MHVLPKYTLNVPGSHKLVHFVKKIMLKPGFNKLKHTCLA